MIIYVIKTVNQFINIRLDTTKVAISDLTP